MCAGLCTEAFIKTFRSFTTSKKTLVIVLDETCYSRAHLDCFLQYAVTVVTHMRVVVGHNWTATANEPQPNQGIWNMELQISRWLNVKMTNKNLIFNKQGWAGVCRKRKPGNFWQKAICHGGEKVEKLREKRQRERERKWKLNMYSNQTVDIPGEEAFWQLLCKWFTIAKDSNAFTCVCFQPRDPFRLTHFRTAIAAFLFVWSDNNDTTSILLLTAQHKFLNTPRANAWSAESPLLAACLMNHSTLHLSSNLNINTPFYYLYQIIDRLLAIIIEYVFY